MGDVEWVYGWMGPVCCARGDRNGDAGLVGSYFTTLYDEMVVF